jgi:hypothetical protein
MNLSVHSETASTILAEPLPINGSRSNKKTSRALRTALLTTTINVPRVLERYRELDHDAAIIVAGDRKTPHADARKFVSRLGNALYLSDEDQSKLGYESSEIIGWNKIMRRNIALLEAIRQKPDIIISIDDDNLPLGGNYFDEMRAILGRPYSGIMAASPNGWFNIGALLSPAVWHRGHSYDHRQPAAPFQLKPVTGQCVGVAAGLWLGDPDIDAMERITNQPTVLQMSDALCGGVVVEPKNYSPFNSQNTGFITELAPLMMVWLGVGRYDDIWASYAAERVMRETGHVVHYGKPYVWQERNPQNRWKNLKDEILGMEHTPQFCRDLDAMDLGDGDVVEKLERLYHELQGKAYIPPAALELGLAWVRDVRRAQGN